MLDHLEAQLAAALFAPLRAAGSPKKKLAAMLDTIEIFYDGGKKACLLERLSASVDHGRFRRPLARVRYVHRRRRSALPRGRAPARDRACARAEDLVVRVEGALVVAAGTGEPEVFTRTIASLRKTLLQRLEAA